MIEKDLWTHIPTEQIEKYIHDTLNEIIQMEREEKGFRLIGDRMSIFRADARHDGILKRKNFVSKLEEIIEFRKKNDDPKNS